MHSLLLRIIWWFFQEKPPLCNSILHAETCQILGLAENLRYGLSLSSCNDATEILKHIYEIFLIKIKKANTTTQQWFSFAFRKILRKKKKLKRLMQQRNTDYHTSRFYYQKSKLPSYTEVFSHKTIPHWFWDATKKILLASSLHFFDFVARFLLSSYKEFRIFH